MSLPSTQKSLRLYFENPVGQLWEDSNGYAIVQYHAGKRKLEELQAFLNHAARLLHSRGWHKLLGDQRVMSAFTEEERVWITDNWLNTAASEGKSFYGAVLIAHDVFARLSMNLVMTEARESALTYRLFESETEAHAWLRQLK
ncbi:hypothetical protein [Hymenobacter sediminicola]|uniref:STAS/SEC14 domain-containing protein n=1 Tax=Hymenobacter sediminicola TaxID=2761579 RepID=A0A7G7W4J3_9BACT|nr:hypothetical protein [Hymenobacter sediminicola]QNH61286.1 hypothetical protein H4317_14100 [Hymenobacter sediminicola]